MFDFSNYEYLNPSRNTYGNLERVGLNSDFTQVVTTNEIKSQLRIDTTTEDALLIAYIAAATIMAENYCNRHFITTQYRLWFNALPSNFSLYYPDCKFTLTGDASTHDGLRYLASVGSTYTLFSDDNWSSNKNLNPCQVKMNSKPSNAINESELTGSEDGIFYFQFKTGIGDAASDIPVSIKQAIKLIVADMYYFREDRKRAFPMASEILLQPYKCYL